MPDLSKRIREYVDAMDSPVTLNDVNAIFDRQSHSAVPIHVNRRMKRKWLVTSSVCLIVFILAVALILQPTSGNKSAAAAVLSNASSVASQQTAVTPGSGQYLYYQITRGTEAYVPRFGENPPFLLLSTSTIQTWVASDGSGRQTINVAQSTPLQPSVDASWIAAGRPTSDSPVPGVTDTLFPSGENVGGPLVTGSNGQYRLAYVDSSQFPTDPAALQQYMNQYFGSGGGTLTTFLLAGDVLQAGAPPSLRAALYQLIEGLPGITVLGTMKDVSGRQGVGIALTDGNNLRYVLVINTTTSAVLSEETLMGPAANDFGLPVPEGTVVDYTSFDSTPIVTASTQSTDPV